MVLVGLLAVAIIGLVAARVAASTVAPNTGDDEPPSRPVANATAVSVSVVVADLIVWEDEAIIAFAPRQTRRLQDLPARDWGVVAIDRPQSETLLTLASWQAAAESLVLKASPRSRTLCLTSPNGGREVVLHGVIARPRKAARP